ncbi:MAG: ABC transporter ATP-binding protein [Pseudolabrys sp.]|nr:ABC transporter ATP-binding protein [Pseudolabrys sp.]
MARIELINLNKSFGAVQAVRNLNFTIEDGEFVVFVGPSGCGKTTTLRMIAGFEDPNSGEIRIDGRVVNDLEPRDRDIGMVFQSHALFPHKNVAQNIEFGLRMKKVSPEERVKRVREVAEMMRISHLLDKMPGQCSGGESQRVALARTLVTNPSTFLLDEPLSSLDAKLRRELRAECDRLHQELKRTFIFVTHDQEEAMTLADRIVVMRDGEIVQVGSPMEIYADPVNYFVADFFGSPSMNLVPGEFVRTGDGLRFRSASFDIALPARFETVSPGKGTLGIRPEHVRIDPGAEDCVHLTVRLIEPLGKDTLLYFDVPGDRAFVAVREGLHMTDVRIGQPMAINLDAHCIHLFDGEGRRIAVPRVA